MAKSTKIGRHLEHLRTRAGLTEQGVARATRGVVSAATLVTIETGHVPPPIRELRALAKLYHVTPWSLLLLAGYVTLGDVRDAQAA